MPGDRLPLFCHVSDVAEAHVRALSHPQAGGKRFLLCGGAFNWALGASYIAEHYPQLRERLPKGWEKAEKKGQEAYARLDTTLAEEILEMKFKGWEEMLKDCIDDLLKLEQKPEWDA